MKKKEKISSADTVIAILFLLFLIYVFSSNVKIPFAAVHNLLQGAAGFTSVTESFEKGYCEAFPNKTVFIDINGLGHRLFAQREVNGVVKLKNGMLSEGVPALPENSGFVKNADNVKVFSDWLRDRNSNLLYVQAPWKHDIYEDTNWPTGIEDYSNTNADIFLKELEIRDVNYLDLREKFHLEGGFYSKFLCTEHHWNANGGFAAFQYICEYLTDIYGEEIEKEVFDIQNYQIDTYKNGSLGYYGGRTGYLFSGFDNFSIIYPKFETNQTCEIVHKQVLRSGSFYEAIFDQSFKELPWRERGMYGMYIGGDFPLVLHKSETAKNDGTVMLFIDSFGTMVESYLTTAYQNVIAVDLRWILRNQMNVTAKELVEEYNPSNVIIMFNPNQLGYAESEQFRYGLE